MDRMSLYYFAKEKLAVENRKKFKKLLSVLNSKSNK